MYKHYLGFVVLFWVLCVAPSPAAANDPHCEGKAGWYSLSCSDPGPNEVVVFADGNGGGKCMRFSTTFTDPVNSPGAPPGYVPNLGSYGFNDCISSVKVGSNARLLAFEDGNYNAQVPGVLQTYPVHNLVWKMATYEPNASSPWIAEATVNDDVSSLIIQDISQTNRERIPHRYIGSDPTSDDHAFWERESQGLCHNRTHWFLTQEVSVGGSPINPSFQCVQAQGLTGRIWKIPRDVDLNVGSAPAGSSYKELKDMPSEFSTWSGYRHFGDPDCQTIGGRDYVFIPVQGCGPNSSSVPLPYVLVLDSDLNFVAGWTIPPQPAWFDVTPMATCMGIPINAGTYANIMTSRGMASWVAVRPGSSQEISVEVWMSTDICNGLGVQVFTGDLTRQGSVPMSFSFPPPVIHDFAGQNEYFGAVQGGVFSPSGNTLYMTSGDTTRLGGIRVILPQTGQEITESGNGYGPFNYAQSLNYTCLPTCIPTGQEPEGIDFLDTRCPGTAVTSTGGHSSQLHVVMNHNGLDDSGDQVEVRHYSVADNATTSMCEPTRFDSMSDPAISSRGGGNLDVFAIAGGRMFRRSYTNGVGWDTFWTPLPALESPRRLYGKPAAVSWSAGRVDLFAHDDLGNIRHFWVNNNVWAGPWEIVAALPASCLDCQGLTAASWGVNRLDVFDIIPNGMGGRTIIQVTYDNGWLAPRQTFGNSPEATAAISAVSWGPSRIDFVATAMNVAGEYHPVQYFSNDGVNFSGPWDLGAVGNVFTFPTNIAISSWAYSDLEIVSMAASTTASVVGQRAFRPNQGWLNWGTSSLLSDPGPVWPNSISSVSSGPGRIDVVFSRPHSTYSTTTVWHAWYNNSPPVGWFGPEPL